MPPKLVLKTVEHPRVSHFLSNMQLLTAEGPQSCNVRAAYVDEKYIMQIVVIYKTADKQQITNKIQKE